MRGVVLQKCDQGASQRGQDLDLLTAPTILARYRRTLPLQRVNAREIQALGGCSYILPW
jgi:hypothetical protein